MDNFFTIVNAVIIVVLLGVTWWHAQSTSRLLRQAQEQVEAMQLQSVAKIKALELSYTQTIREIEGRQQAEEKFNDSEARFAAFMRYLPGTATMRDTQGGYLVCQRNLGESLWPQGDRLDGKDSGRSLASGRGQPVSGVGSASIEAGTTIGKYRTLGAG